MRRYYRHPSRVLWVIYAINLFWFPVHCDNNAIAGVHQEPRNSLNSLVSQSGAKDHKIQFSVTPRNCSVSPNPVELGYYAAYDTPYRSSSYFSILCPKEVSAATISFPEHRLDKKIVINGDPASSRSKKNVTSITIKKSQTSDSSQFVPLNNLYLCNNVTELTTCKNFQLNVGFSRNHQPVIDKILVVNGPKDFTFPYFNSERTIYPIDLYCNVPVTLVFQSASSHRIFVDSNPVIPDLSKGFISSSKFLKYRPRAEPGKVENITVYAATYDHSISRPYTILIKTRESQEPRLASLTIAPGRLEPKFSPYIYSYYARVPEDYTQYIVSLEGLDDVNTRCIINHDEGAEVIGHGQSSVHVPPGSKSGSHTVVIECTSQDRSNSVRYTLALVSQKGGSTLLDELDMVGGVLDRPFNPLLHGPYIANLQLQRLYDQGWIAFVAHTPNPRATITAESLPFNSVRGMSPWFKVEKGEYRRFRIAVRTPENPVEEEYYIDVDRRGPWYENGIYARKLATFMGWASLLGSVDSVSAFLQNIKWLQFLSVSNRVNGNPETYDAWSNGFNKWSFQWDVPYISTPSKHKHFNASGLDKAILTELGDYFSTTKVQTETAARLRSESNISNDETAATLFYQSDELYTLSNGKWKPTINIKSKAASSVTEELIHEPLSKSPHFTRRLFSLPQVQRNKGLQHINVTYKQNGAVIDYMSSILMITILLCLVAGCYTVVTTFFFNRAIKSKDGRVRNMPKILHPVRFWTCVFDVVLIGYAQAAFGILSCPSRLRDEEFLIFGAFNATPKGMMWFSGFVLLLFPLAYICLIGWVMASLKRCVVFSKDLNRYHKKNILMAKAESRIVPWLPIISNLLAIEIRDAFPIFRPVDKDTNNEVSERPLIEFSEDTRIGGPCSVDAPEFGFPKNQCDAIAARYRTNDQHYAMLPQKQSNEKTIHYHPSSDELKVSLGNLRSSHTSDSDNAPLYNKYPDAEVGRKCFKVKNPYGFELDCHALVQMKHLSNLWQMSELPHHFQFWIPRKNCQMMDFDGWNNFFDKSHRGNFFYYMIDRVVFLTIMGVIVCWSDIPGCISASIITALSLTLAALYTPAAISTGTSKWYSHMKEEVRLRNKEAHFTELDKERQRRWPFDDDEVKQQVLNFQREREMLDGCGHGGWFARNWDYGVSQWPFWHHRFYFCLREWFTGAPGLELSKCLVILMMTLGNSSVGALHNGLSSTLALIFACIGSILLNFDGIIEISQQFVVFTDAIVCYTRRIFIWIYETLTDVNHVRPRISHLLKTVFQRMEGIKNASFDYPGQVGERIRDYQVHACLLVADEVGLNFCGTIKPSDTTSRLQKLIGNRHTERYGLTKTFHVSGPIGAHRDNFDLMFPVRLPFRDFYLGKLLQAQEIAATIQIVNHGLRCRLSNPKMKNIFTAEDDSYLSLYRDPKYLPKWGVVRTKHKGHGYVIHYDHETHSLMIKGPSLREGVEYHVRTEKPLKALTDATEHHREQSFAEEAASSSSETSMESKDFRCVSSATCTSSGFLYVPVPEGKPPSLYDPIEIQSPEGDNFTINPNDIKVNYDPCSRELLLRHRLLVEGNEQRVYRVAWTVTGLGVPIDELSTCQESGLLPVKLSKPGVPDLRRMISFRDTKDQSVFTADPKDTDAHQVAIPTAREPRGFGLVLSRVVARFLRLWRQLKGNEAFSDAIEAFVPCTVVQCVNPLLGHYRVEPNFRDAMKSIRAQIHSLEAQRSQLDQIDRLATAWHVVMSRVEFSHFWELHGVNIAPTEGLWVNPLKDIHEPLVKNQFTKIEAAVPEFKSIVQNLFTSHIRRLEVDLRAVSQWVRAYDDISLYGALLQKDMAEISGYTSSTGLDSYVKKLRSFKQQYESEIPCFIYPFVVEERHLSRLPNIPGQLRQWQRQLAVWLRAEEDAPLMNAGLGTPRSVSSSDSTDRVGESASLERTVTEVMGALKESLYRCENTTIGKYRSVLHYATDSLNVRGPYTNWRPDPIGGHVALVRVWYPKPNGLPDFEREPVWNPCCIKLSANAIRILLPGKDDVDFRFSTPYYWSHVLGHSIQLDCLDMLEISHQHSLPVGHQSNLMLKGMPGQLVCRLTSASQLQHVGDQHIRLVENGAPSQEILMRRDGAPEDEEDAGSSPRSSEGDAFLISLGKRITPQETKYLPPQEVRIVQNEAQVFPLTFRFGERFIAKWTAVIEASQMNKPPLEIDDQFGLPITESEGPECTASNHSEGEGGESIQSVQSLPSVTAEELSAHTTLPLQNEKAIYEGSWQNYRYHGMGRLVDSKGNEVYNGEWKNGKRWGKGHCLIEDTNGTIWEYEGEFKNDEICGTGHLKLIDQKRLNELKQSKDPLDKTQLIQFVGEFSSINRSLRRGFTTPLEADKPNISPIILQQLFEQDPSLNTQDVPLIIDFRKAMSFTAESACVNSIESTDSQEAYEAARDEYLPHRNRWQRSFDPQRGFGELADRFVIGTAHYADGSIYQGKFRNGQRHGTGRYMTADEVVRCEGHWKKDVPHGFAVLTEKAADGTDSSYFGLFAKGKRSGHGIQTVKNNLIYIEGHWTNDVLENSEETLINIVPERVRYPGQLIRFAGSIVHGVPTGECKLTWADNVHYRGQLWNGMRHGQGVMRDKKNRVLISATWKNDLPHGRASRLVQPDGRVYTGDIYEGRREGIGELYHSEKGEPFFEGLWFNDMAHGRGTLYAKDGTYEGEFKSGKRHGKGTFEYYENTSRDGKLRLYVGDWKDDLPHGVGKYRNDLAVDNTYKFNKGQLDKSSLNAYKNGMCGKLPLIGVSPIVSLSGINSVKNTNYGSERPVNVEIFKQLLGEEAVQPMWSRLVTNKSMKFIEVAKAPTQAIRPAFQPPLRPMPRGGSETADDFQTESPVRQRLLKIMVLHGKDFAIFDAQSKPYIKAVIGNEVRKTKALEDAESASNWNVVLDFPLRREQEVLLEVWDQDKDRLLVAGQADIMSFLNANKRESDIIEVPLYRPNSSSHGNEEDCKINIRYVIAERPSLVEDTSSVDSVGIQNYQHQEDKSSRPIPHPCVNLKIHQAKDLINMDRMKNMDPYVKIQLGTTFKQTKVQKRAGVNPVFDETFHLPYSGEKRLILEVYDKDILKSDDFVCRAEINLPISSFNGAITLYRADKKKGSVEAGVLEVSVDTVI